MDIFLDEKYPFEINKLKYLFNINSKKSTASQVNKYIGMANIESNTGLYLPSENEKGKGDCSIFSKGYVLFGKLRPYLNKVYLTEFDGGCTTEFIVMDTIDESVISNKFLSIFLLLNCVVNQTKYMMTGNTLPRLQTFDIENLIIPVPKMTIQKNIVDIIDKAYKLKKEKEEEAKILLDGTDDYLLDKLGIKLPEELENNIENRTFKVGFDDIFNDRLDCLKYSPIYKEKIEAINNSLYKDTIKNLKQLIVHSNAGDWGDDEQKIIDFSEYEKCLVLRATEFDNVYNLKIDGERKAYRFIKRKKLKKLDVKENDILIEKSGGSPDQPVGRVALLTKEIIEKNTIAYSNFVHKIRLQEGINLEYIFNYLRTMYNKKITENMQSQTNGIRNLIMNEFLNLQIVLPDIVIQNEIANEIKLRRDKAKNLQNEAKKLINNAKKEVEKIILGESYGA